MSGATPPVAYSIYRYGMHGDNFISLKVMSSKVRLSVPSDIWNTCGADIDVKTVVCRGRRQSTSLQNTIVLLRRAAWHAVLLHSRGGSTLGRSGRRWLAVHVSFCHISHSRSRNWGKSRLIYFRTSGWRSSLFQILWNQDGQFFWEYRTKRGKWNYNLSTCAFRFSQTRGLLLQHSFHRELENNLFRVAVYWVRFDLGTVSLVIPFAPVLLV